MRMLLLRLTSLLVLVSLAGCHTRYGPKGFAGGYEDYPAGHGVHYVSFTGNGYTSRGAVTQMWHRRCAEVCGGPTSYEIVSRDGSTVTDVVVANGLVQTVNRSFAEGYIRCTSTTGNRGITNAKELEVSEEVVAAQLSIRNHPKLPELGVTPKESRTLCKIQGGVQTVKRVSSNGETKEKKPAADGYATYFCRVGGAVIYAGAVQSKDEGFSLVVGYYEGVDVDDVRATLEERLGPPDAVNVRDGYRQWSWQDRVSVRAYESGTKVTFKGEPLPGGETPKGLSTNVFQVEPAQVRDANRGGTR
jgi:hypothetical protein